MGGAEARNVEHTVLVPAYNEEVGLSLVLPKIFSVVDSRYEVLVVDDGSTDATGEVARSFPCRVVHHRQNLGKGEAIKTGVREARGNSLIAIDADDTYPAEAIPLIADALRTHDMVICSRLQGRDHIPPINRVGNWMFRTAIRLLYGLPVVDPLTGLWGLRRKFADLIAPTARYAPDAEMAMKAARAGLRIADLPIQYGPRVGTSKLPPLKAGVEHALLILRLRRWDPEVHRV
jgi:glycosyltransferase involved in cell wall biosynthesis